jgi:hypothetical protein
VTNYYVYYRVDAARAVPLRKEIEDLLDKVERACGVRGRWMRRNDGLDPATYMEVYEGVADDAQFDALLARLSAGLRLERRVERFVCA